VSPAPDTNDGRCHFTVANLNTMPHRSHEWAETLSQLRLAFSNDRHFAIGVPVSPTFGDEGAANHMRLTTAHDAPGVEVFVHGVGGGRFPARQHIEACRAIARRHRLNPDRTLFVQQSQQAIEAGAFHNDVVAVANERVLLVHEQAYEDQAAFYDRLQRLLPQVEIIEVPAAAVSLEEAIASYLFNAQLVTLPDGTMALILPKEAEESAPVHAWLKSLIGGNGLIRRTIFADLRQSMANGGGPACLRLRVVADPDTIDPRFLLDETRLDAIARCIDAHWPTAIAPDDLADTRFQDRIRAARAELLKLVELTALPL
jgi:succinylarginine dihydrolase